MRDNFRPNVRLATNILMVIGTFLIAFNLGQLNNTLKEDPDDKFVQDLCKGLALAVVRDELPKNRRDDVNKIIEELIGENLATPTLAEQEVAEALCDYYK